MTTKQFLHKLGKAPSQLRICIVCAVATTFGNPRSPMAPMSAVRSLMSSMCSWGDILWKEANGTPGLRVNFHYTKAKAKLHGHTTARQSWNNIANHGVLALSLGFRFVLPTLIRNFVFPQGLRGFRRVLLTLIADLVDGFCHRHTRPAETQSMGTQRNHVRNLQSGFKLSAEGRSGSRSAGMVYGILCKTVPVPPSQLLMRVPLLS